jgi:hypothetical protein
MTNSSKCPACGEAIALPAATSQSRFACPACGIGLTTNEHGDLAVEAVRATATSNLAAVPKPPPKLKDGEEEDEWDEEVPRRQPWRRRYSRAAALQKVKGPGILLQVAGILLLLAGIGLPVLIAIVPKGPDPDDEVITIAMLGGGGVVALCLGIVVFLAGMRIKSLRSYSFVLAVIIVTMVIGVLTCIPLAAIPIWPLVVLVGADVRAGFEMTRDQRARGDGAGDTEETESD